MIDREIKFRAWDTILNKIVDENTEGDQTPDSPYYKDEWHPMWDMGQLNAISEMQTEYKDRFVFMQFTGLKDKNGKEIYEGDIVNHVGDLGIIKFQKGGFRAIWKTKSTPLYDFIQGNQTEVIGNIYENLELLEK